MVKNEEDVIESFVRYNINIFDGMIILDNGSHDDTLNILRLLENEGFSLYIFEDENHEFDQFNKRNQLLSKVINEFKADIIVPLDADEFIISTNNHNPRKIIENIGSNILCLVKWKTYVPDFNKNNNNKFIPAKITLSRDESLEEFYKVIIPKELIIDYHAILTPGSHDLKYDLKYENLVKRVFTPNLRIAHFPIRSKDQTLSKIVVGWINELHRNDRVVGASFHWENIFNKLKENEEIVNEDVENFAKEYALNSKVSEVNLYEDPIDLSFCNNLEIIYTKDKVNPISNIINCFEFLSLTHLNFRKESINEEKRLKHEIAEYKNSLSWRTTSPIRKIGKFIRNLRN